MEKTIYPASALKRVGSVRRGKRPVAEVKKVFENNGNQMQNDRSGLPPGTPPTGNTFQPAHNPFRTNSSAAQSNHEEIFSFQIKL